MAAQIKSDDGWDLAAALASLRAAMDPYIWEQGQELSRRGAAEDFAVLADGSVQVKVVDPRDARSFFVVVKKEAGGFVTARCRCPYRLGGHCRHQVVALEYLRAAAEGEMVEEVEPEEGSIPGAANEAQEPTVPLLYRIFDAATTVATRPDGSLLRVVLHALGSSRTCHRLSLQLYTGTGWTDVRTADVSRWIRRGTSGPHPRDALLASQLAGEGGVRSEVDSQVLGTVLSALAGTEALVDRMGNPLAVSPWPWRLAARLVRAEEGGIGVEVSCRSGEGDERRFDEVSLVPSVAPWIQLESGTFHPLVTGASGPVLEELQEEDLSQIAAEDVDRFLADGVARLERLCPGAFDSEPGLIREVEGVGGARLRLEGTPQRLEGQLEFSYGARWVSAPSTPEPWSEERDGKILRFPPAGQSLLRAKRELEQLGFQRQESGENFWRLQRRGALATVLKPRPGAFVAFELPSRLEALDLVERAPLLRLKADWHGGANGRPGEARAPGGRGPREGDETLPRTSASGISWFEVSWELCDGERRLPVDLDAVRRAVEEDPEGLLQLDDGSVLGLQHDPVRSLLELSSTPGARATSGPGGSSIELPLAVVGELFEPQPGLQVEFQQGIRSLVDSLRGGETLPVSQLREDLNGILRGYQKHAVNWLGALGRWGLGGILADEMGLGKTLMALTHFFGRDDTAGEEEPADRGSRPEQPPVLVVCPTSLIFNWIDECRRFFPRVKVVGLQGQTPERREELVNEGADLLVTSYALLRRDREVLEARDLHAVVLDEAQCIKNPESQTAHAACSLRAAERWVLTGTPVENHLGELWSLFEFLLPGFLGSSGDFQRRFAEPIRRGDDVPLARLRARVRPFLLRRTKDQVLAELPPRIEQVERAPLSELQRQLYEEQLQEARAELESGDSATARFRVLAALTRLRQICCHPSLVRGGKDSTDSEEARDNRELPDGEEALLDEPADRIDGGGKFSLLLELLDECFEEGHRVLLFSQFTSMLDLIERRLEDLGVCRCRLDGSTRNREAVVRRFCEDASVPVFLISLKAGGFGLNLAQADTVILYDPWWNPAVEEQAAARAHRIGQTVPVHIHRLITAGTVEEKILELQSAKRELAASVVGSEEEALAALSFEDLKELLRG